MVRPNKKNILSRDLLALAMISSVPNWLKEIAGDSDHVGSGSSDGTGKEL